jgi:hypothetical protein
MSLWNRLKVAAVMWAIFLFIVGVGDAFIDMSPTRDLIFHSTWFHIAFDIALLLLAPLFVKMVGVKLSHNQLDD